MIFSCVNQRRMTQQERQEHGYLATVRHHTGEIIDRYKVYGFSALDVRTKAETGYEGLVREGAVMIGLRPTGDAR